MTSVTGGNSPTISGDSKVGLHELSMRPEDATWIVGRVDTGDFIEVPGTAHRLLELLGTGSTVDEVRSRLRSETGRDIDVASFVGSLKDLGFLVSIDGTPLVQPEVPRPTLPSLRPAHVRWLLHPATAAVACALGLVAVTFMIVDPGLVPGYRDLLWSEHGSAIIVGNAVVGWSMVFLHELGHLATARAADVPARMSLGTRLQFLVAQTDVSGVWARPRRVRMAVYLAGMVVNLVVAAVALILLATVATTGFANTLLTVIVLLSVLPLPYQFLVFMRTDVYFIVQDVTRCTNLYAEAGTYLRDRFRAVWRRVRGGAAPDVPSLYALPERRQRVVKIYSVILFAGTITCLAVALAVTLPVGFTLLWNAVSDVVTFSSASAALDGATVLLIIGGLQALWFRAWWRRHGGRVAAFFRGRGRAYRRRGGDHPGTAGDSQARDDVADRRQPF